MDSEEIVAQEQQQVTEIAAPASISHEWEQRGTDLVCNSCPHPHSSINAVPIGKMLIKNEKGDYDIVPITPL